MQDKVLSRPDEIIVDIDEFTSDDLNEGSTNLYYTDERSGLALSVDDTGGDGSLSYNNACGESIHRTLRSEVRAHFSDGAGLTYDPVNGIYEFTKTTWLDPLFRSRVNTLHNTQSCKQ